MTAVISDALLHQLSDFVAARLGLHFPKERWRDLERGIISAGRESDFTSAKSYAEWLLSSPHTKNQIELLASHLTVGETYFFREKESLDILADSILPELIHVRRKGDKHLRIWSVACSTGEEPYTVAILLDKVLPDIKTWNIAITATDINIHSLQKASGGIYGEWSFRTTPQWIRDKYFEKRKGKRFEISKRIKEMVTFSYLNLVEDVYPSLLNNTNGMDVILCRNVLMYFTQEQAGKVVQRLYLSLVNGGWLITSPVDTSRLLSSRFTTVKFPNTTLYKKDDNLPRTVEAQQTFLNNTQEVLSLQSLEFPAAQETKAPIPLETNGHLPLPEVDEPIALYEKALRLYKQGRYAEVVDKILNSKQFNQHDSNILTLLTRAHANQGRLADAFTWCEKAVAADKTNPALHYLLAIILQEQGQVVEAIASLKRALYLNYDFVLAHFALGNLMRQQGKLKESEKHLQNALTTLGNYNRDDILPESEGITAGRLIEIINSMNY